MKYIIPIKMKTTLSERKRNIIERTLGINKPKPVIGLMCSDFKIGTDIRV